MRASPPPSKYTVPWPNRPHHVGTRQGGHDHPTAVPPHLNRLQAVRGPPALVRRVLQADQPCGRVVGVVRVDCRHDLCGGDAALVAREHLCLHACSRWWSQSGRDGGQVVGSADEPCLWVQEAVSVRRRPDPAPSQGFNHHRGAAGSGQAPSAAPALHGSRVTLLARTASSQWSSRRLACGLSWQFGKGHPPPSHSTTERTASLT